VPWLCFVSGGQIPQGPVFDGCRPRVQGQQEVSTITLIARLRHVSTYTPEQGDIRHPIFVNSLPETPTSIHASLSDKAAPEQRTALRIGILTQQNTAEAVAKGTPLRLLPTLVNKLEFTCLQHSHKVWLERNKEDETDDLRNDTMQRHQQDIPSRRPTLINVDDTEHSQTVKWEHDRHGALGRLKDWNKWGTTTTDKVRRQTQQPNTPEYQIRHLFTLPTDAQYSTAAVALTRTPHAHAIQSLRKHAHMIVSSHR
jgi:hypothetical protein